MNLCVPKNYKAQLSLKQTEIAIKRVKQQFQQDLANNLNLLRVSAPLFVDPSSGLNDDLNGVERAVAFDVPALDGAKLEIVHSLAKWKRDALLRYDILAGSGLYTDMNAIRRDEDLTNIHSLYVDQWDWEANLGEAASRNRIVLQDYVNKIYTTLLGIANLVNTEFGLNVQLPKKIVFMTTQELEDNYPDKTPKEREYLATKECGAVFLQNIGGALNSGKVHDGRAPDYDDWQLNGDILLYSPLLDIALEISSMGIRVDESKLKTQLKLANCEDRLSLPFHQNIINKILPYSIGGGIGQSRLCMFFLQKAHIGEVQVSLWPQSVRDECEKAGIELL